MYIPIILGTAREGRQSEKVVRFILNNLKKKAETEIIDVKEFGLSQTSRNLKNHLIKNFSEKIKRADRIIIVVPEYNGSYPGELKILLDSLYEEYEGKNVGIVGVSAGEYGGIRAIEETKTLCKNLKMIPFKRFISFPKVQELFDENGKIKNKKYEEELNKFILELKNGV